MIDFSKAKAGDYIEYIGDSLAYGGIYKLLIAEATYNDPDMCPEYEKGKLMICEFTNSDKAMFFTLDRLKPNEWKFVGK